MGRCVGIDLFVGVFLAHLVALALAVAVAFGVARSVLATYFCGGSRCCRSVLDTILG